MKEIKEISASFKTKLWRVDDLRVDVGPGLDHHLHDLRPANGGCQVERGGPTLPILAVNLVLHLVTKAFKPVSLLLLLSFLTFYIYLSQCELTSELGNCYANDSLSACL